MATSLAAQAQQAGATYSAPGVAVNENIATPATSRYISQRSSLQNFTAPMTPRYYTGGTGGFRSYSPGQQATLRGAGQTAGIIGTSLARSAMSAAFPATSAGIGNALGLTVTQSLPGHAGAFGTTTVPTQLGATLGKAMPYIAAATAFFTTQGSFGRKAGNAAAAGVSSYLMTMGPWGIAAGLAIMGIQMLVGSLGGKGSRNIPLSGYRLPENAPELLKRLGVQQAPTTLRKYRHFMGRYESATAPLKRAESLVQTRLKSLGRIFPSMKGISEELTKGRAAALSGSGSPGEAFAKLQGYVNALTQAEGFIEGVFADKAVQGYIKRKTNMPFEEFKRGFDFSTDVWIDKNIGIPGQERARTEAVSKSKQPLQRVQGKASVINRVNRPTQLSTLTQSFMDNYYTPIYGRGRGGGGSSIKGYRAVRPPGTGGGRSQYGKSFNPGGKNYKTLQVSEYEAMFNKAQTTAMKQITNPFDVELARMRDFTASEPQFGSYTQFRPFQPNWTPGMPQLGLSADAPGPDLDSLKTVLNVQDGQFAGMSGGSGYPLTRFGMGMVPRTSQGKMARQA
jgi:hypothetical protein